MKRLVFAQISIIVMGLWLTLSWNITQPLRSPVYSPTPTVHVVTTDEMRVFPSDLVCDEQDPAQNGLGPTWMGITIGKSTFEDLKTLLDEFGYEYRYIGDDYDKRFFVENYSYSQSIAEAPGYVRICLKGDVIQVLSIAYWYPLEPTPNLTDYVALLGQPDAITWTNGEFDRIAFWFEHGFAVGTNIIPDDHPQNSLQPTFGRTGSVYYFPYQDAINYETRWPYNKVRKYNQFLVSPEDPNSGIQFGVENPFDFDSIIATITAQPPNPPTLIFTLLPPIETPTPIP